MPTITIRLDDETDARLKRQLERSAETISDFVRTAVVNQLAAVPAQESPYEAWSRLVQDCTGSGESDRSQTYMARIKDKLRAKHRR
ncbi:MAG: hypothetical protein ABL901_14630 [Hyphomicrobiaceae bacterium]